MNDQLPPPGRTLHLLPWAYYAVSLMTCQIRSLLAAHSHLLDELTPRRAGCDATYTLACTLAERLMETPPQHAGGISRELFSEGMLTRLIAGLLRGEEEGALIKREAPRLITHPDERALLSTIALTHQSEGQDIGEKKEDPPYDPKSTTAEEDHLSQVSPDVRYPDEDGRSARGTRIRGQQRSRTSAGRTSRQRWRNGSLV